MPHIALEGNVSEPLSGRFSVTCRPEEGGEGIQRAILKCRNVYQRSSILLLEGIYLVREKLLITRDDEEVHIFGRGRAELRGALPLNTDTDTIKNTSMIKSISPSFTLDRIRIDN